jgi:hypothetical protein
MVALPTGHLEPAELRTLTNVAHVEGVDLATAIVDYDPGDRFRFATDADVFAGRNVWTAGFPPITKELLSNGDARWDTGVGLLKGYVVRPFLNEHHPGDPEQDRERDSLELDMPTPAGLSGSPLFIDGGIGGSLDLVGMVYGSHDSYTVPVEASVEPETGLATPEVRRHVSFGIALPPDAIASAMGPATDDRRLGEVLDRVT